MSLNKALRKGGKHFVWLLIAFLTGGAFILYWHDAPTIARTFFTGEAPLTAYFFAGILTFTTYMLAGTMPGSRKPQRWYDEGYLRQADSVEALARQIDIDPNALTSTNERFNGFVANNRDEDFHRGERAYDRWLGDSLHLPSPTLGAIDSPPFFAVPVVPGDVGTYGGVVTDEHARVLREDGSVIPRLYATGVSTASVMGRVYPGAGSSVGPAFVWGYVAAKHVAGAENSAP